MAAASVFSLATRTVRCYLPLFCFLFVCSPHPSPYGLEYVCLCITQCVCGGVGGYGDSRGVGGTGMIVRACVVLLLIAFILLWGGGGGGGGGVCCD